jgi:DNA-binding response OmpR family regulator
LKAESFVKISIFSQENIDGVVGRLFMCLWSTNKPHLRIRGFQHVPEERLLLCNGGAVALSPEGHGLLLVLVESHGHLLQKDELMKQPLARGAL